MTFPTWWWPALHGPAGGAAALLEGGLELFVAEGARSLEAVHKRGAKVFLDLKLHDIPETVARAVGRAKTLGVELMTLHTGGLAMMGKPAQAAQGQPDSSG